MERSSGLYHVNRIHAMTGGLRILTAYPHDGGTHDKGSGLSLAGQYRGYGLNMMDHNARNHGTTNYAVMPAIEEMREMLFQGKLKIGPHNYELIEELRGLHYDDDHRIQKIRDDLVSALRYAIMERRSGKPRLQYDGVGRAMNGPSMPFAGHQCERPPGGGIAKGRRR
jgi:hypothetical protein